MGIYQLGDILETKKKHPCGCSQWEVIRTGADYKIKCRQCGRIVMLPYEELVRRVKKVVDNGNRR